MHICFFLVRRPGVFVAPNFCTPEVTDDVSIVESFHKVRITPGKSSNIKVTTPDDLWFAERALQEIPELFVPFE